MITALILRPPPSTRNVDDYVPSQTAWPPASQHVEEKPPRKKDEDRHILGLVVLMLLVLVLPAFSMIGYFIVYPHAF